MVMVLILIEHHPKISIFNVQYKSINWFLYEIQHWAEVDQCIVTSKQKRLKSILS